MTSEQYLAAVQDHLIDLPWRVRKNLAEDLRAHLKEIPAEDLVERLGNPGLYAADLRSAAGLAPRRGPIAFVRARRPRNVAIALVLVIMLALLIAGIAWASNYQPLRAGSYGMHPDGHVGPAGEFVAPFRDGRGFQYGVSVKNTGRFAVRILDLPRNTNSAFHLRPFTMRITAHGMTGRVIPFRSFTLRPGQERLVLLRGSFARCRRHIAGMNTGIGALPVRERSLFWTHTVLVPLIDQIIVQNLGDHCR